MWLALFLGSLHFSPFIGFLPSLILKFWFLGVFVQFRLFYLHSMQQELGGNPLINVEVKIFRFGLCVQWKFPLDTLDGGHVSKGGHVSIIQCVQWQFPLDTSRVQDLQPSCRFWKTPRGSRYPLEVKCGISHAFRLRYGLAPFILLLPPRVRFTKAHTFLGLLRITSHLSFNSYNFIGPFYEHGVYGPIYSPGLN